MPAVKAKRQAVSSILNEFANTHLSKEPRKHGRDGRRIVEEAGTGEDIAVAEPLEARRSVVHALGEPSGVVPRVEVRPKVVQILELEPQGDRLSLPGGRVARADHSIDSNLRAAVVAPSNLAVNVKPLLESAQVPVDRVLLKRRTGHDRDGTRRRFASYPPVPWCGRFRDSGGC